VTILRTENLTKKFGSFTALNGVNIEVDKGEVYGFIGPNGAGKSTTIRILLGILKPTIGEAQIFGQDVWKNAVNIHKRIAYVPGDVNLWPNLTGGEVIDLLVKLRGSNNKSKREELIERFNFDPTKKCRTYSKGNRQKVALIAAFSSDADLYIFDEPTSGLDPLMEKVFHECVFEVKKAGKSVFLSSHILSEVEKLCDKIAIIREGQIIEHGTLNDLRHLTGTILVVETQRPIPSLDEFKDVKKIERNDQVYSLHVDHDQLDSVIKRLSQFGIAKLESAPPALEDLFLKHYEDTNKSVDLGVGGLS